MNIGLEFGTFDWAGQSRPFHQDLAAIASAADQAGFYSMWISDHFGEPGHPWPEAWTTLAFLAAHTRRMLLGTLVTSVTHRPPAVLVKQASTLADLSGGRAYFGVGAGWNAAEHRAFGLRFPSTDERFNLLEETLQIAHGAWRGDRSRSEGRLVREDRQLDRSLPIRSPHPPILIGGCGERRTLRLVAQYADASNCVAAPVEFQRKMAVLREHCEEVGRDFEWIERTSALDAAVAGRPDLARDLRELEDDLAALEMVGVQHVIVALPDLPGLRSIHAFADRLLASGDRAGPSRTMTP